MTLALKFLSVDILDGVSADSVEVPCLNPDVEGNCWIYRGSSLAAGYGCLGRRCPNGERLLHRVSYAALRSPIPMMLELDHLCRVKACWNPWHVEPVTHSVNVRRAVPLRVPVAALSRSTVADEVRACLKENPSAGVRDIARRTGRNPGTISRVVKKLKSI